MNARSNRHLRGVAALVAAVFFCQEFAWAAPGAGGIATPATMSSAAIAAAAPHSIGSFIANPAQLDIPFDAVTLQEVHPGTNGKLIIHIQDAHANLSGQQSLAKAVDHFLTKYGLKVILVEGADRDVTLDPIRKLAPLSEWKIIARRFLYEGIISGEEYLNLTSEQPMKLRGIEYQDLYNDAVRAYASLVDRRKDILHYLYQSKVSLDRLKVRMYPQNLLDYEKKKTGIDPDLGGNFKDQAEGIFALCEAAQMSLEEYPQMMLMKELFDKEKSIDFERANREQASVLSRVSPAAAKSFAEASKRLRSSQVSQYRLIQQLLGDARAQGLDPSAFPALAEYSKYLEKFLDLKIETLMAEQELLEDRVFEKLLPDDDARKVRAIDRFLGLLGNAYKLQMSSHDFKMFEFNEKDFPTETWLAYMNRKLADLGFFESMIPTKPYLEEARADFGKFYSLVGQRDEAFVENAHKIMAEEKTDAVVLIAGGYHTDHLTELLRAEGTSYIVLTPFVNDKTDQAKYEEILLSQLKAQTKHLTARASELPARPDTGSDRAQNVAVTRIPRGVRAAAAPARLAELSPGLKTFMGARLGDQIPLLITKQASELINATPNQLGARMAENGPQAKGASKIPGNRIKPGFYEELIMKYFGLKANSKEAKEYMGLADELFEMYGFNLIPLDAGEKDSFYINIIEAIALLIEHPEAGLQKSKIDLSGRMKLHINPDQKKVFYEVILKIRQTDKDKINKFRKRNQPIHIQSLSLDRMHTLPNGEKQRIPDWDSRDRAGLEWEIDYGLVVTAAGKIFPMRIYDPLMDPKRMVYRLTSNDFLPHHLRKLDEVLKPENRKNKARPNSLWELFIRMGELGVQDETFKPRGRFIRDTAIKAKLGEQYEHLTEYLTHLTKLNDDANADIYAVPPDWNDLLREFANVGVVFRAFYLAAKAGRYGDLTKNGKSARLALGIPMRHRDGAKSDEDLDKHLVEYFITELTKARLRFAYEQNQLTSPTLYSAYGPLRRSAFNYVGGGFLSFTDPAVPSAEDFKEDKYSEAKQAFKLITDEEAGLADFGGNYDKDFTYRGRQLYFKTARELFRGKKRYMTSLELGKDVLTISQKNQIALHAKPKTTYGKYTARRMRDDVVVPARKRSAGYWFRLLSMAVTLITEWRFTVIMLLIAVSLIGLEYRILENGGRAAKIMHTAFSPLNKVVDKFGELKEMWFGGAGLDEGELGEDKLNEDHEGPDKGDETNQANGNEDSMTGFESNSGTSKIPTPPEVAKSNIVPDGNRSAIHVVDLEADFYNEDGPVPLSPYVPLAVYDDMDPQGNPIRPGNVGTNVYKERGEVTYLGTTTYTVGPTGTFDIVPTIAPGAIMDTLVEYTKGPNGERRATVWSAKATEKPTFESRLDPELFELLAQSGLILDPSRLPGTLEGGAPILTSNDDMTPEQFNVTVAAIRKFRIENMYYTDLQEEGDLNAAVPLLNRILGGIEDPELARMVEEEARKHGGLKGIQCSGAANFTVLVLRANGIPAYRVDGYSNQEDPSTLTGKELHSWVNAWDGEDWQLIETTEGLSKEMTADILRKAQLKRNLWIAAASLAGVVVLIFLIKRRKVGEDDGEESEPTPPESKSYDQYIESLEVPKNTEGTQETDFEKIIRRFMAGVEDSDWKTAGNRDKVLQSAIFVHNSAIKDRDHVDQAFKAAVDEGRITLLPPNSSAVENPYPSAPIFVEWGRQGRDPARAEVILPHARFSIPLQLLIDQGIIKNASASGRYILGFTSGQTPSDQTPAAARLAKLGGVGLVTPQSPGDGAVGQLYASDDVIMLSAKGGIKPDSYSIKVIGDKAIVPTREACLINVNELPNIRLITEDVRPCTAIAVKAGPFIGLAHIWNAHPYGGNGKLADQLSIFHDALKKKLESKGFENIEIEYVIDYRKESYQDNKPDDLRKMLDPTPGVTIRMHKRGLNIEGQPETSAIVEVAAEGVRVVGKDITGENDGSKTETKEYAWNVITMPTRPAGARMTVSYIELYRLLGSLELLEGILGDFKGTREMMQQLVGAGFIGSKVAVAAEGGRIHSVEVERSRIIGSTKKSADLSRGWVASPTGALLVPDRALANPANSATPVASNLINVGDAALDDMNLIPRVQQALRTVLGRYFGDLRMHQKGELAPVHLRYSAVGSGVDPKIVGAINLLINKYATAGLYITFHDDGSGNSGIVSATPPNDPRLREANLTGDSSGDGLKSGKPALLINRGKNAGSSVTGKELLFNVALSGVLMAAIARTGSDDAAGVASEPELQRLVEATQQLRSLIMSVKSMTTENMASLQYCGNLEGGAESEGFKALQTFAVYHGLSLSLALQLIMITANAVAESA